MESRTEGNEARHSLEIQANNRKYFFEKGKHIAVAVTQDCDEKQKLIES